MQSTSQTGGSMSNVNNFFFEAGEESSKKEAKKETGVAGEKKGLGKSYQDEYLMLLTASQFLATIQKIALYAEPLAEHETDSIVQLIVRMEQSPGQVSSGDEQMLAAKLSKFRSQIEASDERVQTANIRRLFESVGTPDSASTERVIRYYLTKENKTIADRDKIDLLVTRWGSFRIPGPDRMVFLRSERNLQQRLEKIFNELGLKLDASQDQAEVLEWLDFYRESLLTLQDINEIIEKDYKARLREFKLALGGFFYNPPVLTAIVETNITLHNILQEFYMSERSRLELYVDHAKRKTGELQIDEKTSTIFSLMSRAEEMRRILTETQEAISSQQVVDQSDAANSKDKKAETGGSESRVDELVSLLEQTLQKTNELSRQIQQEMTKIYDK